MPLILGTNSIKDTGYDVANSLRFNDGSSDNLSRSTGTPSSRQKFTFSTWIKLSSVSGNRSIFNIETDGNTTLFFMVKNGDQLHFVDYNSSAEQAKLTTNALHRDPSAWYHVVLRLDSTQGTNTDRCRLYVNGSEVTSFSATVYPSQNYNFTNNVGNTRIGVSQGDANYWDGYMAETVYCDNQSLDPTSFGEFDSDSPNIWKPIDVSGLTFGNEGFYLDFENASSLGADVSGNGNNFTVNNLTSIDQSTDTCTNNFATLNPLFATQDSGTITEGNTIYTASANAWGGSGSTIGLTQGKWYFEIQINNNAGGHFFGVIDDSANVNDNPHQRTGSTFYYSGGQMYKDGSGSGSYSTFGASDIGGVYLNLDDNQISIYKNGSAIVTDFALSTTKNTLFVWVMGYNSGSDQLKVNFGGTPPFTISSGNADANGYGNFEYSPTLSGVNYYSINTKNLAEFG